MRRLATLLIAVALTGGCGRNYVQSRRAAVVGGVMILAGAAGIPLTLKSMFVNYKYEPLWHKVLAPPSIVAFITGVAVGIPLALGGLVGMGIHPTPCEIKRDDELRRALAAPDPDERARLLAAAPACAAPDRSNARR